MPSLQVNLQKQQNTHWCWVAVTASIAKFYNPTSHWSQSKLIEQFIRVPLYGKKVLELAKTTTGTKNRTNFPGKIEDGLRMVQCFRDRITLKSSGTYEELVLEGQQKFLLVKAEIDLNRPVVCGVRPKGSTGEGHAVIIVGYESDGEIKWKEPQHPEKLRISASFQTFMWDLEGAAYLDYMIFTKSHTTFQNDPRYIYSHH